MQASLAKEESQNSKDILNLLLQNADVANKEQIPMCQDTGFTVVFVELGQDVQVVGSDLTSAINKGVRRGYLDGYMRKSIVDHPLRRKNTDDNTPCVLHVKIVPGNTIKVTVAPKGGGSENMSGLKMLKPAEGIAGIKKFVLDIVKTAGPNACPPLIVGIGLGGTMEKAALLAKEALLREIGTTNPDQDLMTLEQELLVDINQLGIGPQGLGGSTTALAVHIEAYATHIASLPVAVNLNCHAARHKSIIL